MTPPRRSNRAFTLIELIVVVLILGILASVSVVAYGQFSSRAQGAAAQTNLRQIATAVLAQHTVEQVPRLTRDEFVAALDEVSGDVDVQPWLNAAGWTFHGPDVSPQVLGDFAVGFDTGQGTTVSTTAGTRAVVMTEGGNALYARVIVYGMPDTENLDQQNGTVPAGTTPADVLRDPTLIGSDAAASPGEGAPNPPAPGVPAGPGLDYTDPTTAPGVRTATSASLVSGPMLTGPATKPVAQAAGGFLLHADRTVSLNDGSTITPVTAVSDVIQIAIGRDGPDQVMALTRAGDVYLLRADGTATKTALTNIARLDMYSNQSVEFARTKTGELLSLATPGAAPKVTIPGTVTSVAPLQGSCEGDATALVLNAAGDVYITHSATRVRQIALPAKAKTIVPGDGLEGAVLLTDGRVATVKSTGCLGSSAASYYADRPETVLMVDSVSNVAKLVSPGSSIGSGYAAVTTDERLLVAVGTIGYQTPASPPVFRDTALTGVKDAQANLGAGSTGYALTADGKVHQFNFEDATTVEKVSDVTSIIGLMASYAFVSTNDGYAQFTGAPMPMFATSPADPHKGITSIVCDGRTYQCWANISQ